VEDQFAETEKRCLTKGWSEPEKQVAHPKRLDFMVRKRRAPPIIAGLYVVAYAHADRSVRFEQRHTLNVGGKWLGRVPCLALCRHFERAEFMVQHCNNNWEPRGIAAGYRSIEEVKQRVERSYHGITAKWKKQIIPIRKARATHKAKLKAESCSFCGRPPLKVTAMLGRKTRICHHCVDSFHEAIHSKGL
jgi:hypothetical protein